MTTPNPPQPNQQNPQIVGTNQLAGRMDALNRSVSALTSALSRGFSGGTLNSMAFGGPAGGRGPAYYTAQQSQLNRQMASHSQTFAEARIRAREDLDRLNGQLGAGHISRGDYDVASRRLTSRLNTAQTTFTNARASMQEQVAALNHQQRTETRMNRMAAVGQAVGAVGSLAGLSYSPDYANAQAQFYRQLAPMNPVSGRTYGDRARTMAAPLHHAGLQRYANSDADLFTAGMGFYQNYGAGERWQRANEASALAMGTPGLGATGALGMQTAMGSAQGFYASMGMGLGPTRRPGGTLVPASEMAGRMLKRSFGTADLRSIGKENLEAALRPEGMLTRNINQFAGAMGWDATQEEAFRKTAELKVVAAKGFPSMSETEIDKLFEDAASGDKKTAERATKKLGTVIKDFGGTALDADYKKKEQQRNEFLATSGSVQNAMVDGAKAAVDIRNMLAPVFGLGAGAKAAYDKGGIAGLGGYAWDKSINSGPFGGDASFWGKTGNYLTNSMKWGNPMLWGANIAQRIGGQADSPGGDKQGDNKKPAGGGGLPSANVSTILGFAKQQLGDRYVLGANGPDAWDCSSLTEAAFRQVGMDIGADTYAQWGNRDGLEIPMDQLQPGDLVFYGDTSHVGIYEGGGQVLAADNPSVGVVEHAMESRYTKAKRFVSGVLGAKPTLGGDQNDPTKSWGGGGVGAGGGRNEVDILAAALAGRGRGGGTWAAPKNVSNQNDNASGTGGADKVTDPNANVALGRKLAATYGWSGSEFDALYELWMGESEWKSNADNPSSDAYGIPQAMSNLYPETATSAWRNSPEAQIRWGLDYIKGRYGSPSKALSFWKGNNPHWYDRGAWDVPGDQVAKLHAGEMVLTKGQAATVRAALMEQGLGGPPGGGGGTVHLTFGQGSVVINMPSASAEGAQSAAEQFVSFIAADDRIKSLLGGW
ncbi:NlpC/P60 family protein [Streptomyces sp. NPDC001674]|uniref:aggregation-promoting factor C-terminal-like domain-containing protein n=1 Tax=Streptomyces sp. NPDC001674 TaxID=3154394 RepID=UPI003321F975